MVDKWAKPSFVASLKEVYYLELGGMFFKNTSYQRSARLVLPLF